MTETTKKWVKYGLIAAAAIAVILIMKGCGTLSTADDDIRVQLAIQVGTGKFIEAAGKDEAVRADRAMKVQKLAQDGQSWLKVGETTTMAELKSAVLTRIAESDLQPSDKLLANALANYLASEVQERVDDGVLSAEEVESVNNILQLVEGAASIYLIE